MLLVSRSTRKAITLSRLRNNLLKDAGEENKRKYSKLRDYCVLLLRKAKLEYFGNVNPSRLNPGRTEKIKLNLYFHTSLWFPKRFYDGLKGFMKALKAFIKPF